MIVPVIVLENVHEIVLVIVLVIVPVIVLENVHEIVLLNVLVIVLENVHEIVLLNVLVIVPVIVLENVHEIVLKHADRSKTRRSYGVVLGNLFVAFGVPYSERYCLGSALSPPLTSHNYIPDGWACLVLHTTQPVLPKQVVIFSFFKFFFHFKKDQKG